MGPGLGAGRTRRGRNWYTAMGVLFIVSASIVMARQLVLWTPDFVAEFLVSPEFTNEKVSAGMIAFGCILLAIGLRSGEEGRGGDIRRRG